MGYTYVRAEGIGYLSFWSLPKEVTVDSVAGTEVLNSVSIPDISDYTVRYARAMVDFADIRDLSGALNYVDGGQKIQIDNVAAGGWIDAINIPDRCCQVPANGIVKEPILHGTIDIKAKVNFNDTISFQWLNADALGSSLSMYRLTTGIYMVVN